jgi:hypothetical protein
MENSSSISYKYFPLNSLKETSQLNLKLEQQSSESKSEKDYYEKCFAKIKLFRLTSERFKYDYMSESAEAEINKAKEKQRSEMKLNEWGINKFYKDDWCQRMLENPPQSHLEICYENYDDLSVEDFKLKYESLSKPLIIKGGTKNWKAKESWDFEVILLINNYCRNFITDSKSQELK